MKVLVIPAVYRDMSERNQLEAGLRDSERKYRTLFENMRQGALYRNADGKIADVNQAALLMLGLSREEMLGRTSDDRAWGIIREDGSAFPAAEHPSLVALETGEPVRDVVAGVFNPQKGCYVWMVVNAFPDFHPGETAPCGVFLTLHDITERKRMEEALRESEEMYRGLYQNAAVGIFSSTFEGRFLNMNPALAAMLGYASPREAMDSIRDIARDVYVDRNRRSEVVRRTFEEGQTLAFENVYRRKNGELFDAYLYLRVVHDKDGKPSCLQGIVEDVTERKRAEERLRRTFDQAPIGAAIVSMDYRFLRVNQALCRITGYSEEELTSLGFPDITHPDDIALDIDLARKLEAGEIDQYEMDKRYIRKDGSIVWIYLSVRMMKDAQGKPVHFIPMMEDISERKRAELELVEKKELLQAQARHLEEVNTALKVLLNHRDEEHRGIVEDMQSSIRQLILPYLERVERCVSNAECKTLLDIIKSNLNHITANYSKMLPAGSSGLTPTETKIADLVRHGKTNKEIAALLNISVNAVSFHRKNIRKKFGLKQEKINLQSFLRSNV